MFCRIKVCAALVSRSFSVSASASKDAVGFVGLGNMGAHMARNLLKKGYPVVVFDVNKQAVQALEESGASSGSTPADVAGQVKQLVTMLPSSPHVRDVYTGDAGILSSAQSGTLMIDSSTIDPAVSQEMESLVNAQGSEFMDAPVSGGVVAARDALLTFMVGGKEQNFPAAKELLDNMGKNVVHCGAVGTGQAAKICNNMLLGISMIGASETMNLGMNAPNKKFPVNSVALINYAYCWHEKHETSLQLIELLGLDPKMLAKILNMSSGRCWSTEMYNPCPGVVEGIPASNNYQGGFGAALMTKDLGLAQNAATATQAPTPMGSLAHQIYRIMCNSGYANKDFASAFKFIQEMDKKE